MSTTGLSARVLLAELEALGLTIDDLVAESAQRGSGPTAALAAGRTVAEYVPVVAAGYPPRTQRTDNSYWRLLGELLGDRPIAGIVADDLNQVADEAARRAGTRRRGSTAGRAGRRVSARCERCSHAPTSRA